MRTITDKRIAEYRSTLVRAEKKRKTIDKYMRDLKKLQDYLSGREVTKERLVRYKEYLEDSGLYAASSINSFLAAANSFCAAMGWTELHVRTIRIQNQAFESEDKELTEAEYWRLVRTAVAKGNERIALIIQTLGSTGIRINELQFITVESLNKGMQDVYNKGKVRRIMYPRALIMALEMYVDSQGVTTGSVFQTRTGRPLDRSNIWRDMKMLCKDARVSYEKVYPHNLRHLFARSFYRLKKDIAVLSDILGHSDVATTRIYIRSTGREHQKQLDMMHMVIDGR